jgi:Putative auto-transporter adhesin, head GIN domain
MRLRIVLASLVFALPLTACSVTTGSGQISSEPRQVSGFTKVELTGNGELTIEQTGTESLTISAAENILPRVSSEVSGDTLVLGPERIIQILPSKPITYALTVKDLTGLAISGSGSVNVSKLATPSLSSKISGSGTMTANGTADNQDLDLSGSGRYRAEQLIGKRVKVAISGSGSADVHATEVLDIQMSGSGTLSYTGNPPQITQEISGSGKVIKK